MEIEIQESRLNKIFRIGSKVFCIYVIVFGILIVIMQIVIKSWYLGVMGVLIAVFGYYNKKRVGKIIAIKDNSLVLLVEKSKIELNKEDISSISKWVGITPTQYFALTISLKKRKFGIVKSYFVANEPGFDFLNRFAEMEIRLKNVPS